MKSVFIFAFLGLSLQSALAVSPFEAVVEEWEAWKLKYNKNYEYGTHENAVSSQEESFRMKIWLENKAKIEAHNRLFYKGVNSYSLRMNQFADLLHHEFVAKMNGFRPSKERVKGAVYIPPANVELPDEVDWVSQGAVTDVKDQGQCGSCWTFSTSGVLEGQHFRKTGELISLSEQQIMDCDVDELGCDGGDPEQALTYIKDQGGLDTEESYPYKGYQDTCKFNSKNVGATDTGLVQIKYGDENDLKNAVATIGPIAVAIDASHDSFQHISGDEIYSEPNCDSDLYSLDHAVLVVGYGTTWDGKDYWLVKNSWGTSWGNKGYFLMARNQNNMCGIATYAAYPTV